MAVVLIQAGGESRVNTSTAHDQDAPAITALADGGYVVTWHSFDPVDFNLRIYLQRYDASGTPVGPETQVNTTTMNWQDYPAVTALADGGYVVTWHSYQQDGEGYGVYLQRYGASGERVGPETQVNTTTTGDQANSTVTALADGGYVVTWDANPQDGDSWGVYMQRYDASGAPVGPETRVNTTTANAQQVPVVTALVDGGYVVT